MKRIKFEGTTVGDLYIKEYLGNKKYLTMCNKCGAEKIMYSAQLASHTGVTCTAGKPDVQDLVGEQVGEWKVLSYEGNKRYLCQCSCGAKKLVLRTNLLNGSSKSCGHWHKTHEDLTGKKFGEWTVLRKAGYNYECQCSCGKISIKTPNDLTSGKSKSCGHGYNEFNDISGQTFGLWHVLEYLGDQHYLCQCSCENKTIASVRKADLLSGLSRSCGCAKGTLARQTRLEKYGDPGPNRANNPRTPEQIAAIDSKESLENFIESLNNPELTPTLLSRKLGIQLHRTLVILHNYNLVDKVRMYSPTSAPESDIYNFIKSYYSGSVKLRDRKVLNGKELDIYLPDLKLAIEFNGSYWHSDSLKDKNYHMYKTVSCGKQGISLIHIFEYEWNNAIQRTKIETYLRERLTPRSKIYARKLDIKQLDVKKAMEFLERYHLQGYANSKINLALINSDTQEIYAVMTFGHPRFSSDSEYELIRLCYKPGVSIVGGAQKLFSYFIKNYSPSSIVTYTDLAKFNGNVYLSLGFKLMNGDNVKPNYVWFNPVTGEALSRYQCQKHKLLEAGLGEYGSTEDDIMRNTGHLKIYDAGQLKFLYT